MNEPKVFTQIIKIRNLGLHEYHNNVIDQYFRQNSFDEVYNVYDIVLMEWILSVF